MKSADLIKKLEAEGWYRATHVGSHIKFRHPDKSTYVTVPHPRKDILIATLKSIYKQAGWKWR